MDVKAIKKQRGRKLSNKHRGKKGMRIERERQVQRLLLFQICSESVSLGHMYVMKTKQDLPQYVCAWEAQFLQKI